LRLRITPAAETAVRSGHPWVFAESVQEANRAGQLGDLAVIYDRNDKFLAVGLLDPVSPIRVRILHMGKPEAIDAAWWQTRLDQAVARRAGLFDAQTSGCRLVHGESDGWPGLVLDRYDNTLVLKLYTAAWLPRLDEVLELIKAEFFVNCPGAASRPGAATPLTNGPQRSAGMPLEDRPRRRPRSRNRVVLRLSRNLQPVAESRFGLQDGQIMFGEPPAGPVIFSESGLRFEADVLRGQKTGFFLDQRENRREVETLARDRRVLNAFSFSGGFSVYAARGVAASVTDLDISAHALESARRNFVLNMNFPAVAACRHETVQADAFGWIEKTSGKFDLIVLDPPALAKRAAEREGAIRAYERLNALGVRRLAPNGILAAGSCSAHVSAAEFFDAVRRAAVKSGREFSELKRTHQPPDHPATFKEAEYLKMIYLTFRS
jgi:23S rRNA (cytosine1962-C5)-methyltransferase